MYTYLSWVAETLARVMVLGTVRRTVCPRDMAVSNVLKVVDLGTVQEQRGCNTVNRRIAPALIEELVY